MVENLPLNKLAWWRNIDTMLAMPCWLVWYFCCILRRNSLILVVYMYKKGTESPSTQIFKCCLCFEIIREEFEMLFLVIRCKNYGKTFFRRNIDTVSMLRQNEGFFAIFFLTFRLFMDKA